MDEASLFVTFPLNVDPSFSVTVAAGPVPGAAVLFPHPAVPRTETNRNITAACFGLLLLCILLLRASLTHFENTKRYTEPA
jgi:hypothetical protein